MIFPAWPVEKLLCGARDQHPFFPASIMTMDQGKAANGDGGGKGNVSSALGPQWHHLCVVRGQMHCNPGHLASNRCSPPLVQAITWVLQNFRVAGLATGKFPCLWVILQVLLRFVLLTNLFLYWRKNSHIVFEKKSLC